MVRRQLAGPDRGCTRRRTRAAKKPREAAPAIDGKYVAAARELRDRYLEHVNTHRLTGEGKYDVSREIAEGTTVSVAAPAALPAPVAPAA